MNRTGHWVITLLLAGLLAGCGNDAPEDSAAPSATVTTVMPSRGAVDQVVTAYGAVSASADAMLVISVQVAGRVAHWNVADGATVKRGQPLLSFALAPSAVAARQQAQAALTLARDQRTHVVELLSQQLATRDQLAQADKALVDAQTDLDALVQQQGRDDTLVVPAPFDGTVSGISASPGESLAAGAPLLTLQRGDGMVMLGGLERGDATRVREGQRVALMPIDGGATLQGRVHRVAAVLDAKTHQVDVEIVPEGTPMAGEGYRAAIVVGQASGWLLPRDAVQGDDGDRHVFQVKQGKAVRVAVKMTDESGAVSVGDGAIDAASPLVVVGATQLDDGMTVRATPARSRP